MATVSEIIVQAYREGNFIAVGEVPTADEVAEAVPRLNSFIASLFGIELGEVLHDWYAPNENEPAAPLRRPLTPSGAGEAAGPFWIYPPPNARLLLALTEGRAIYFPAAPSDGARMALVDVGSTAEVTLSGNGRKIEGAATLTATPAALSERTWLYRADLGDWVRLKTLVEVDVPPLPDTFDDLLICGLTIRLAPRFGVVTAAETAQRYVDMLGHLKKRYKQEVPMPNSAEPYRSLRSEI